MVIALTIVESRKVSKNDDEVRTTRIKLRGEETPAPRRTSLTGGSSNFNQIISQLTPETQGRVLIARADEEVEVSPRQTLAKVRKHKL